MFILPILSILAIVLSFFYVKYFIHESNRDFSKNTGFLFTKSKPIMPWLHIIAGMICGFLVYPDKYNVSWEDPNQPKNMNKAIWSRQIVGLVIFLVFTVRNFNKHPKNVKKNLNNCGLELPNLFYSSITRQQAQFLIGVCIAVLIGYSVNKGKSNFDFKSPIGKIFMIILSLTLIQFIIQGVFTLDPSKYAYIRQKYLLCMEK